MVLRKVHGIYQPHESGSRTFFLIHGSSEIKLLAQQNRNAELAVHFLLWQIRTFSRFMQTFFAYSADKPTLRFENHEKTGLQTGTQMRSKPPGHPQNGINC